VLAALPRRAVLSPDANVRAAGKLERLLVLPAVARATPEQDEEEDSPSEPASEPTAPDAEAKPAPRELNGRINVTGFSPLLKKIEITNSDAFLWTDCVLVTTGRQVYRLGRVAPNTTQAAPLRDFRRGGADVDLVKKDRVGLVCAEGRAEFPAKDL